MLFRMKMSMRNNLYKVFIQFYQIFLNGKLNEGKIKISDSISQLI